MARTLKVWRPRLSRFSFAGDAQGAKAPLSSLHSKADPASLEEKRTVAVDVRICRFGAVVITVCGALVSGGSATASTVNERVAPVASTFPARSSAKTENVWDP